MEVKYDEEDLRIILFCSLLAFYISRDTILYSCEALTIKKVYDALFSNEKIKYLVGSEVRGDDFVVDGDYVRSRLRSNYSVIKSIIIVRDWGTLERIVIRYRRRKS